MTDHDTLPCSPGANYTRQVVNEFPGIDHKRQGIRKTQKEHRHNIVIISTYTIPSFIHANLRLSKLLGGGKGGGFFTPPPPNFLGLVPPSHFFHSD